MTCMKKFLPIFIFFLLTPSLAPAQSEEDPARPPGSLYWRVQFFSRISATDHPRKIKAHFPPTNYTQEVLSLKRHATDYSYSEKHSQDNTLGIWESLPKSTGANWVIYDALIRLKPLHIVRELNIPETPPENIPILLELSAAEKQAIHSKMGQLDLGSKQTGKKIRILFDYIVNSIELTDESRERDVLKILEQSQGDKNDKIYLFRAMLQEMGALTRLAHGFTLKDRTIRTDTSTWVEVFLSGHWLPFDVIKGHFTRLPQNRLTLYSGDLPFFGITKKTPHNYQFVITEISEELALDMEDLGIPQDNLFDKKYFSGMQKRESFVKSAIGNIAIVTDNPVNDSIVEKISKHAARADTKVHFYNAPYESTFFKGSYIAKILSDNLSSLQTADALFILSEDDSGLYALFRLSQGRKKLKNTTIFLSGKFSEPVAHVLGYSLYKLLKPKELFIIPAKLDMERAWDVLQDGILDALPLPEVAKRWNIPIMDLSQTGKRTITSWRKFLIKTWVLAAKAEVNLESIYLILILPVIALGVVIFRNVIGVETFGTFTPVIVSVAFLTTGLFWGILLFVIIVATGIFFRQLFHRIHIHLVARMAMIITVVGITMLALLILSVHMGWGALANISILPMVIMSGIVENFTRTQMEVGFKQALKLTLFTLFVASVSYLIIAKLNFPSLVLVFPELTLVAILLEILIGRWNGLRLLEYLRFYRITSTPNA